MGVGRRGQREAKTPLDFEMISKKLLFLQFRGEKVNFTTFGPRWKTFCENPLLPPPLEKILSTPMFTVLVNALVN